MVDNLSPPFSAVGLVAETIGGVAGHGSGVFIAPDEFLTAAHVVWTQGVGAASNVFVVPALNGTEPFGEVSVTDFHYFSIADAGGSGTAQVSETDFALLHLSKSVTGTSTMALVPNYTGGSVTAAGYPGSTNIETAATEIAVPSATTATFADLTGLGAGSSGGPIWTGAGVVGVISTASNSAALSAPILATINAWIAADHAGGLSGAIAVNPIDVHTITNATDHATVFGALGGDIVTGSGNSEWIVAGIGNESLTATGANSIIFGGSGADTMTGTGSGTFMLAGSGATTEIAGLGVQGLAGGASADTFRIDGNLVASFDAIYSFGATDKIQIHAIAGSPITTPALAEAFELSDGHGNTFDYLGKNTLGDVFLIVVGAPHISASQITFV